GGAVGGTEAGGGMGARVGGEADRGARNASVRVIAFDGGRPVAHVLPLAGARRRAGIAYASVAAVLVRRAVLESPSPPDVISNAYNLTPPELPGLMASVAVGGAPAGA